MIVTLKTDTFQEEVARFETLAPPNNGDYFDIGIKYAHGHNRKRYKVVNRIFQVVSERKRANEPDMRSRLEGCICIVAPGA